MSDRHDPTERGICQAPAGEPWDDRGEHIGRHGKIEITSPSSKLTTHNQLVADDGLPAHRGVQSPPTPPGRAEAR